MGTSLDPGSIPGISTMQIYEDKTGDLIWIEGFWNHCEPFDEEDPFGDNLSLDDEELILDGVVAHVIDGWSVWFEYQDDSWWHQHMAVLP